MILVDVNTTSSVSDQDHASEQRTSAPISFPMTNRRIVLLITGRPGVGKTTALRRVADALGGAVGLGGFYTEEIRRGGERQGFRLVTFDGRRGVMARADASGGPRVGKYRVDVDVIDALAASALAIRIETRLYLVDEVGKMECLSPQFVAAMRVLLHSDKSVVATIAERGSGFIEEVKRHPGAELWTVTRANRDAIHRRIVDWLRDTPP